MSSHGPLSITQQVQVLRSDADVATFSLQHLELPSEWRDTNQPGNTERCQDAVNRVFTLSRAELEACLTELGITPEQLPGVRTTEDSRDGTYFIAKPYNEWDYYHQERGSPWACVTFTDLTEAQNFCINEFIPVWLKHLRVPVAQRMAKPSRTCDRPSERRWR